MTTHRLETKIKDLISIIRSSFDFLIKEYGYVYELKEQPDQYSIERGPQYYLVQFSSIQRQRLLEIVLQRNSDKIYFTIRRILNGKVADYADNDNCVRIEELDFLIKEEKFNYKNHRPFSEDKKKIYFEDNSLFLKEYWLPLLKGETWIDRKELEELSMNIRDHLSGIYPDKFLVESKKQFNFLTSLGFEIISDTDRLAPYERSFASEIIYEHVQSKEGYRIVYDYRDYGFRIDHYKNGNRSDDEMIVHSQKGDEDGKYVERAAVWLKNKIDCEV